MQVIIGIFVILIVIGIIGSILEWAKENIGIVVLVGGIIVGIYIFGFWTALKVGIVVFGILCIIGWISSYIAENNEKHLKIFLKSSCTKLGYMNQASWRRQLPQFANLSYTTSFDEVTSKFTAYMEKKYINSDPNLSWLDPAANYLKKAGAADVWELEQVHSQGLEYTHCTPNGKLIQDAMDKISDNKIINGKHLVQKVPLEAEAVCKEHNFNSPEFVPEYYLRLYTINEYFRARSFSKDESNIETEEISLDDL